VLGLRRRAKPEPLVEFALKTLVAFDDRFSTPERCVRLHRQLNRAFVRAVDGFCCLSEFERARWVARLESEPADALEEIDSQCGQSALLVLRPQRVDSCEWFAAEKGKRLLKECASLVSSGGLRLPAKAIELVEVDQQLVAVERISVAVASKGVAEQFSRLAYCLVEASCAAAGIVARPERFEEHIAAGRTAVRREVGDEFGGCLPSWLSFLAASELKGPQDRDAGQVAATVARCHGRRQSVVPIVLLLLWAHWIRLGLLPRRESEDGRCERCSVYAPIPPRDRRTLSPRERAS
jgi:hypothetical protein